MNAAGIAPALGGRRWGAWWSCRCPAHDDRTPSLSIRDGDRGLIVHCWAGCDPRDVLAELHRRGLLASRAEYRPRSISVRQQNAADDFDLARRIAAARRIWLAARETQRTPAVCYLVRRGITLPIPPSLRWAPALWRPDGTSGPAIIARIDNIDGELIGVHRTWLHHGRDGAWSRRDRAMLGRAAGGAVRLAPAADTLLVAEGVESVLAGMTASGLPGWAALSTSGLAALALPPIVRHVVILGDHDRSGAGERAARAAAARWQAECRETTICMSPRVGEDAADLVLAAALREVRRGAA